jgi:hypothetical protein
MMMVVKTMMIAHLMLNGPGGVGQDEQVPRAEGDLPHLGRTRHALA